MTKRFILILALVLMFLATANSASAGASPGTVYVDTANTGTEDGTQDHPYNTRQEGIAFAQAQPGGAWLYTKQADGKWSPPEYVRPAWSGRYGISLTNAVIYALLAVFALALILVGWRLQRRSGQLPI